MTLGGLGTPEQILAVYELLVAHDNKTKEFSPLEILNLDYPARQTGLV